MESFVLAETLKYLLLLFADARGLPAFFVLTTEGHLLAPFPAPGDAAYFGANASAAGAAGARPAEAQVEREQDAQLSGVGPSGAVCPVPCAPPLPDMTSRLLAF